MEGDYECGNEQGVTITYLRVTFLSLAGGNEQVLENLLSEHVIFYLVRTLCPRHN